MHASRECPSARSVVLLHATVCDRTNAVHDSALRLGRRTAQNGRMATIMFIAALSALLGDSAACRPAAGLDPVRLLRRAADRTGLPRSAGEVLKTVAFD